MHFYIGIFKVIVLVSFKKHHYWRCSTLTLPCNEHVSHLLNHYNTGVVKNLKLKTFFWLMRKPRSQDKLPSWPLETSEPRDSYMRSIYLQQKLLELSSSRNTEIVILTNCWRLRTNLKMRSFWGGSLKDLSHFHGFYLRETYQAITVKMLERFPHVSG